MTLQLVICLAIFPLSRHDRFRRALTATLGAVLALSAPLALAAEATQRSGMQMFIELLPLLLLGVVFWFLIIRPQMKRNKEHRELMAAISKGDEVVTAAGIVGTVMKVEQQFVVVQVADKVELRFQKATISATLPKGTLKALDA